MVGGVVALAAIAAAVWLCLRRRRRNRNDATHPLVPEADSAPAIGSGPPQEMADSRTPSAKPYALSPSPASELQGSQGVANGGYGHYEMPAETYPSEMDGAGNQRYPPRYA